MIGLQGCGMQEIPSHWRDRPILIDGKDSEWGGLMKALDDAGNSAAIVNDSNFVYVSLVTANHDLQRQVLRRGIIVWFDREGGKDKKFGVHYPLGIVPGERGSDAGQSFAQPSMGGAGDELEIYTAGEDQYTRMTMAQTGGIDIRFNLAHDTLVYEMRVPLFDDGHHPFAIGASAGIVIGIGFETPGGRGQARSEYGNEEGEGGMGRRGMGRRGGRPGGEYGGGRRAQPGNTASLDIWAKVSLAAAPGGGTTQQALAPR